MRRVQTLFSIKFLIKRKHLSAFIWLGLLSWKENICVSLKRFFRLTNMLFNVNISSGKKLMSTEICHNFCLAGLCVDKLYLFICRVYTNCSANVNNFQLLNNVKAKICSLSSKPRFCRNSLRCLCKQAK